MTTAPEASAAYSVSESDIAAWMHFAIDRHGDTRRAVRTAKVLFPLLTVLLGLLVFELLGALFGLAVGLVVGLLVLPSLMTRTIDARLERSLRQLPDGLVGEHALELTPDLLIWSTTAAQCRWKRSAIREVGLTDQHAFVMFGPDNALVLPIHADRTGELRRIVALLRGEPPPITAA